MDNNTDNGGTPKKLSRRRKRNDYKHNDTSQLSARRKKGIRIRSSLTSSFYFLRLGSSKSLRQEHRRRLQYLLRKLVNRHDWVGASGVLSVYLKGTVHDCSPFNNRFKFWVLLELLKHMENHSMNSTKIGNLYDIWCKNIGSMKTWPVESRHAVHLEFMLFSLMQGNVEDAYHLALCLQEKAYIGPVSEMIMGLTFYELWYSSIPEEFKLRDFNQFDGQENSHEGETSLSNEVGQSEWHNKVESHMADSQYQCHSDASVMNERQISRDISLNKDMIVSIDANIKRERSPQILKLEPFFSTSDDEYQRKEDPLPNNGGLPQDALYALGRLDLCLLPLHFSDANNLLDFMFTHRNQVNDHYKNAEKYLRLALNSTSAPAALLPLIQILLMGGRVNEALIILEKQCHNSYYVLPTRLRTILLEHFDRNNLLLIQSCYEDILKKDPTCSDSLAKLIMMHQRGEYSLESLLEMIALHLDSTDAEHSTWKVFSLCFSKVSLHEEDCMSSTCSIQYGKRQGQHCSIRKTPKIFTEGISRKSWNLRCRWWLTKYFSNSKFESTIETGDLQLLTYKAACAVYMYGQELSYVVKTYSHLQKENNKDLLLFLNEHKRNSYVIYNKKAVTCIRLTS